MNKSYSQIQNEAIKTFKLTGKHPRAWSTADVQAVDNYVSRQLSRQGMNNIDPRVAALYKNADLDANGRHEALQKLGAEQGASDALNNMWSDFGSDGLGAYNPAYDPYIDDYTKSRNDERDQIRDQDEEEPDDEPKNEDSESSDSGDTPEEQPESGGEPGIGEDVDTDYKPDTSDATKDRKNQRNVLRGEDLGDSTKAAEVIAKTADAATKAGEAVVNNAVEEEVVVAVAANPYFWVVVGIISFLLIMVALWGLVAQSPDSASALDNSSNCAIYNVGTANSSGYYQLPALDYYSLNLNGGSPRDAQWGNKDTIDLIVNVGKSWSELHPDQKFSVGDINDSGHASHTIGIDIDIYGGGGLMMSNPGGATNQNYNKDLTIALAKSFIDTGAIDVIGYSDQTVVDEINKYKSGSMANWSGHDDHFHVRVVKGAYTCVNSVSTNTGKFGLPVDAGAGFSIVSKYGWRIHPTKGGLKFHYGVDVNINGTGDANRPVYAIDSGTIISISRSSSGCASIIKIQHTNELSTKYIHLASDGSPGLSVGSAITKGQLIGKISPWTTAQATCSTGPHLHFETYKNGSTVDPEGIVDFSKL